MPDAGYDAVLVGAFRLYGLFKGLYGKTLLPVS